MSLTRNSWKVLAAAAALCATQSALAADGYLDGTSIEVATGTKTQIARFGVQRGFESRWFESNGTHLSGYWDFTVAAWRLNQYHNIPGATSHLWDIGVTPVWRFESDNRKGWYGEGAIGAHWMSHLYNNNGHRLSTAYEFGDHIGLGYVFDNNMEVGFKIQHYSNGGIKHPNSGVNTVVLKVATHF
ncbi:MAG: acyloxyacyl hydrolase [Telluria sp.]